MSVLQITYTTAEGTLLRGDVAPNDAVSLVMQQCKGWHWSRKHRRWFMHHHSNDPRTRAIDDTARALRAAGHTVTVSIDRTNPSENTTERNT